MNAILYARHSPRPEHCDGESIELQIAKCTAYCTAQGYTIADQCLDEGISGARADNRPGLQKALDIACNQKAVLVVYSLSRLTRSTKDALEIAARLHKHGANLAMLDLNFDTATPMGHCVFTILSAVAELERKQIGQRTSDALQRYQAEGWLVSRHPPYGYKVVGKAKDRLEKDDQEQAAIGEIVAQHAAGATLRDICDVLTFKGMAARKDGWTTTKIRQVLKRQGVAV